MDEKAYSAAALEIARGAYDLHVHSSPSHFPRELDDFQLVREADAIGMAGVLIKSHYEPTAARAALVNAHSGAGARAWGGITLNWSVGGLNPYAVESALKLGAAVVWMPTLDSENNLQFDGGGPVLSPRAGISVLDGEGNLLPPVREIMALVRQYGAHLATGHLSVAESWALCREGVAEGINMILTHPESSSTSVPMETQQELARMGVLIEKAWFSCAAGMVTEQTLAANFMALPPGSVYLTTDRGQAGGGRPAHQFLRMLDSMLAHGAAKETLTAAARDVPRRIVGLE